MSKNKSSGSGSKCMENIDITEFLLELANFEKNVNRNIHKYNAYRKASAAVAAYNKPIESGAEAKKLEGVGEKIAQKIDEYLDTGKLDKLDRIRKDDKVTIINTLTRVSGIGPTKARELFESGIRNLTDLRRHQSKLNRHQKLGLKYFDDFEKKIPRDEIEYVEKIIRKDVKKVDRNYIITVCGSYRRGLPESGDIDVLITHPSLNSRNADKTKNKEMLAKIIDSLDDLVIDNLAMGETKYMGVIRLEGPARRLDVRLIPFDQYYCGVLYFTGSDAFNRKMRQRAVEQRFSLNEYNLKPVGLTGIPGEPVTINSEKDIFDYIDFPYKEPHQRNL